MKKTIFIFNDGTGQQASSKATTNVAKLYSVLPGVESSKHYADKFKVCEKNGYTAIYIRGIGTDSERYTVEEKNTNWFQRVLNFLQRKSSNLVNQALGTEIKQRVEESLKAFGYVFNANDETEIILVGFSRGAASIRILAAELIKRYNVNISYMLIFDTVYSVTGKMQILDGEPIERFENYDIHPNILKCDHLIAGDEMRDKFPLSHVNPRVGVRQILFSGSHSDVGGGHESTKLSDFPLKFALDQMNQFGVKFDPERELTLKLQPDAQGPITWDTFSGIGQAHYPRPLIGLSFTVHKSVVERATAKGSVSIALAQLCSFTAPVTKELIDPTEIDASFDL